jgi:parvulin-like peptidyl-prolyl isomerase
MRRVLLTVGAAFLLGAPAFPADLVERIVARVNDRLITQSEFDKRIDLLSKAPQGTTKDRGQMRRDALDDLIKEKLLAERAKELSVDATDAEIEEALARVKAQYNLTTEAEFEAAIAQTGLSREELRKQMRDTITIQKVVGRDMASRLDVTDDMLRLEYERQKEKLYPVPEQARVSEIVVRFARDNGAERERAGQRIAEAQGKLKAGAAFADVAKEYSEGGAKDRGGDLGIVSRGELIPALDAAVFADPPSEYPPPVLTPTSMHLFRVRDRKPAAFRPFNDVKDELRKKINDDLYEKRFTEYVTKLRKEAFVKIYDSELEKLEKQEKKS